MASPFDYKTQAVSVTTTATGTTVSTELVAAITGKRIAVKSMFLNITLGGQAGLTDVYFLNGSTRLSGDMDVTSSKDFILDPAPADGQACWMKTAKSTALNMKHTVGANAVTIGGMITYVEIP